MQSFLPLKAALLPINSDLAAYAAPVELPAYLQFYQLDKLAPLRHAQHRIGYINSGNYRIATQYWLPPQAQHTVLLVHGYYDHVGLYRHVIAHFLQRGFAVLAFDLPGHGLSTGARADITSFDEYGLAIHDVLRAAASQLPPITLGFGQSTGCTSLLNYLMAGYAPPLQQLVLFAPLLRPHLWARSGRWTYQLLHRWIKQLPRRFSANSGDREFLHFCQQVDPLQARFLSVAWVTAMQQWLEDFSQQPGIDLPALIVQGQQDNTVDWRYNIPQILQKLPQARLHYIAEARHHLANESPAIRAHVWQIVDEFLNNNFTE